MTLSASFNFGQLFGRDFQGVRMSHLGGQHGQEEMDNGREVADCAKSGG